jgi:hypothetical protein
LEGATLVGAKLSSADLIGANLRQADLSQADLSSARMMVANLEAASLNQAKLLRTNLSDANLQFCQLNEANLNRAYLTGANLAHGQLHAALLSGANLLRADLQGTDLSQTSLRRAYLSDANISHAILTAVDLNSADVTRLDFSTATVTDARFGGNLGLSEQQRSHLHTQGAMVMPLGTESSDPENLFGTIRNIDEAKADLEYRFFDLDEALRVLQEEIEILQTAVADEETLGRILPNSKIYPVIATLEQNSLNFIRAVKEYRQDLLSQFEQNSEQLREWITQEFPQELDTIHANILKLNSVTYTVNQIW